MRNGKCTREFALVPSYTVTIDFHPESCWKTEYGKCTHSPRWVHNKTIAQAFVLTLGLSFCRIALSFCFGCKWTAFSVDSIRKRHFFRTGEENPFGTRPWYFCLNGWSALWRTFYSIPGTFLRFGAVVYYSFKIFGKWCRTCGLGGSIRSGMQCRRYHGKYGLHAIVLVLSKWTYRMDSARPPLLERYPANGFFAARFVGTGNIGEIHTGNGAHFVQTRISACGYTKCEAAVRK